ncbi:hypothetical protein ZWY2020_004582 [Hordeum vulgare]|nr:hypothetical protein ZWY2020_004582 [Hordeum vulgare]
MAALPARIAGMLLVRFVMSLGGWPTRLAVCLIDAHLGRMGRAPDDLPPAEVPGNGSRKAMPAQAKKKKKPKKKKADGATPGVAGCPTPLGVPEPVATEPPARVGRQRSREDTMCINCGCAGHFRSECEPPPPPPPRCPTTLAYLRYGTERGSFYFVNAEIEEEVPRPHLDSVTLAPEQVLPPGLVISADLIQAELATYIGDFCDSEFTWEVTETTPLVFSVPFPSAELLRMEPELVPPLEKVWVLVYDVSRGGSVAPRGGKLTHILKAISEPVGKLVTADLASFEDDGPARIEILCPAPAEIDGVSLIFYFGSRGRRLTFELESPASVDLHGPAPTATVPGDDGRDGDGGSSEESSFCEEDDGDGGVAPAASDGRRTPVSSAAGPSGTAGAASRVA